MQLKNKELKKNENSFIFIKRSDIILKIKKKNEEKFMKNNFFDFFFDKLKYNDSIFSFQYKNENLFLTNFKPPIKIGKNFVKKNLKEDKTSHLKKLNEIRNSIEKIQNNNNNFNLINNNLYKSFLDEKSEEIFSKKNFPTMVFQYKLDFQYKILKCVSIEFNEKFADFFYSEKNIFMNSIMSYKGIKNPFEIKCENSKLILEFLDFLLNNILKENINIKPWEFPICCSDHSNALFQGNAIVNPKVFKQDGYFDVYFIISLDVKIDNLKNNKNPESNVEQIKENISEKTLKFLKMHYSHLIPMNKCEENSSKICSFKLIK